MIKLVDRVLENKTRMTIEGHRYRLGNVKHPFYELYKKKGFNYVYQAMGIVEDKAAVIRKEVLALYDKNKEGEVYAISNPAWDGWIKIGMAVDAEDRLKSYQTSSPCRDYVLLHREFFNNRRRAEAEAHILASEKAEERRGEWFKIKTIDAINIINSIDNTVKDGLQELKEVFTKKDKQGYYE